MCSENKNGIPLTFLTLVPCIVIQYLLNQNKNLLLT